MQTEYRGLSARRRKTGNILILVAGLVLLGSAAAKLAQLPPVVAQMSANGFSGARLQIVAVLEVVSTVLFLAPRTRSAGLLMISAFLGGAIATHMGHGEPIFGPAIVLTLLWLGAWLRHPEILWSFRPHAATFSSVRPQAGDEALLRQL
jgi:hypothetical protein